MWRKLWRLRCIFGKEGWLEERIILYEKETGMVNFVLKQNDYFIFLKRGSIGQSRNFKCVANSMSKSW